MANTGKEPQLSDKELQKLEKELIESIISLLDENASIETLKTQANIQGNRLNALIVRALFSPTPDTQPLRKALLDKLNKGTLFAKILHAATHSIFTTSYKTTILAELPKGDKALLEQQGDIEFLEAIENKTVLKVETTRTETPPNTALLEKIFRSKGGTLDIDDPELKLAAFPTVDKELWDEI